MKLALKTAVVAIALMTGVAAFAASDEEDEVPGVWYGSVSVGQAHNKFNSTFGGWSGSVASTNVTDKKTGLKVAAGYKFTQNFSMEVGYTNLGKFVYGNTLPPGGVLLNGGTITDNYSVDALHISAVGTAPIYKDFSLFGKVGVSRITVKTDIAVPAAVGVSGSSSFTQSKALVGVGLRYDVNRFGVRAEYEDYGNVGNPSTNTSRDSLMSVGLDVRF